MIVKHRNMLFRLAVYLLRKALRPLLADLNFASNPTIQIKPDGAIYLIDGDAEFPVRRVRYGYTS